MISIILIDHEAIKHISLFILNWSRGSLVVKKISYVDGINNPFELHTFALKYHLSFISHVSLFTRDYKARQDFLFSDRSSVLRLISVIYNEHKVHI